MNTRLKCHSVCLCSVVSDFVLKCYVHFEAAMQAWSLPLWMCVQPAFSYGVTPGLTWSPEGDPLALVKVDMGWMSFQ